MLHWIGWVLLIVSAVAAGLFAAYMLALTVWSLRDWDDSPFARLMVVCGFLVCMVSGALSGALANIAYNWRPWC